MAEILHQLVVRATATRVLAALTTAAGLDSWWTMTSAVTGGGSVFAFGFGPEYDWRAQVVRMGSDGVEWEFTRADGDWTGTRVGFGLKEADGLTTVCFSHRGWAEANEHFRVTSFCWALYLRHLKRYVEAGVVIPYSERLEGS